MQLSSLFISHGAPDLILHEHPARTFLEQLGRTLPRPDGIVVVSAHWRENGLQLTGPGPLETLYDFRGFPEPLYQMTYPATASRDLVDKVCAVLEDVTLSPGRGLDHGAWAPLLMIYPKADIPVVQLSLDIAGDTHAHYEVGKKLRRLSNDNILLVASGASVHNLAMLGPKGSKPAPWALAFEAWLAENISANNLENLLEFEQDAPDATLAHPTSEHLMPLFVALGAAPAGRCLKRLHHSFDYGSIGMSCFGA